MQNITTLINVTDGHRKFYTVEVNGRVVLMTWGRIGTKGQHKIEVFASDRSAAQFSNDKVESKLNRGYELMRRAA